MESVLGQHPVQTDLDAPYEVARWRPMFAWVLAIPHFIVLSVLSNVAGILVFIAWFAIVFTGRYPQGLFDFVAMYLRYQWRTLSYACGLHEAFPPFEFGMDDHDDGHSPAVFTVEHPETLSRGLVWVKWLLVLPNAIALCFVGCAAFVVYGIGAWVVLFTGRWPEGMRDFLVGTARWSNRTTAYLYLLTDAYPPYSLR